MDIDLVKRLPQSNKLRKDQVIQSQFEKSSYIILLKIQFLANLTMKFDDMATNYYFNTQMLHYRRDTQTQDVLRAPGKYSDGKFANLSNETQKSSFEIDEYFHDFYEEPKLTLNKDSSIVFEQSAQFLQTHQTLKPNEEPPSIFQIHSRGKKIQKSNKCGHQDKPHYAKEMCRSCYSKYGRTKKPWKCSHQKLYAQGLCQSCYTNSYNHMKKMYRANPDSPTSNS